MHWELCLCCRFGSPQPLADPHPGTQRSPGPCPAWPAPGRAKKALKEMMELCKKSLPGKLSSLSLLPAQPVVVELTESPMVLRPLCKVSLTLSVLGHGFSNFYRIINFYYYYFLKFCRMVFLRHMFELRADPPTLVSITEKSLTESFLPFWIAMK